ncbi:hypothetical protein [Salipaludibacillus sp. CF4.18]
MQFRRNMISPKEVEAFPPKSSSDRIFVLVFEGKQQYLGPNEVSVTLGM